MMKHWLGTTVVTGLSALFIVGCATPSNSTSSNASSNGTSIAHGNSTGTNNNTVAASQNTTQGGGTDSNITNNSSGNNGSPTSATSFAPKHIVVVMEENHAYNQIVGNRQAPYINQLIKKGALFTNYHAVTHPSQPNYIALFAGGTFGVRSDSCPQTLSEPNLGSELVGKGDTFTGYSESLPSPGFSGCYAGNYGRKHVPWVDFSNLSKKYNQPFSRFPTNFNKLPTVSFVIPNVRNDMHSGTVSAGDKWLQQNLGNYDKWAKTHNSLLIITFDEGFSQQNQVATIFYGDGVKVGRYNQSFTHYSLLRTIESFYNLKLLGESKTAKSMDVAFQS